jgi:hydroxymethylpyrimidine pyrophosphatase-like HAD family hydrolase
MILAIDWDNTIHDKDHPTEGHRLGAPMEGAKESLQELRNQGHTIIIHTANNLLVVTDWMNYFEMPYDRIVEKVQADFYLDDKGHHFTDWKDAMDAVSKL